MFVTIALISVLLNFGAATPETPAMPKASFKDDLAPRSLGAGCGLITTFGGQVSPLQASGYANLCLQCRVNIFGLELDFSFYNSLTESISARGVSFSDAVVLQSSIQSELLQRAATATTSAQCKAAFSTDTRCASYSFVNGQCKVTAVNYVTNNKSPALATAFQNLFATGGARYCSICSGDRSCASPSARARRSLIEEVKQSTTPMQSRCPAGLTACPISSASSLTPSDAYECLDVSQEINSCGGCVTLGDGIDCSTLRGVSSSGCSEGKCNIFSCKAGYRLSKPANICLKRHQSHATKGRRL